MRPALLLVAVAAAAALVAPSAPALPPPEAFVVYAEWEGSFLAGSSVGVGAPPAAGVHGLGPVNLARFTFEADDCRRDLRLRLDFSPDGVAVDSPAVFLRVPHKFQARLADAATGAPLHDEPLEWRSPGTLPFPLAAAGAVEVTLQLTQGADVDYSLRVSGWRADDAECRWQGQLFVNALEPNPPGEDRGHEWFEVWNNGFEDADVSNWTVSAEHGAPASLALPEGTVVPMGGSLRVTFPGQFLDNEDEVVSLTAPRGWVVDRTPPLTDRANDERVWRRAPDGSEEWRFDAAP